MPHRTTNQLCGYFLQALDFSLANGHQNRSCVLAKENIGTMDIVCSRLSTPSAMYSGKQRKLNWPLGGGQSANNNECSGPQGNHFVASVTPLIPTFLCQLSQLSNYTVVTYVKSLTRCWALGPGGSNGPGRMDEQGRQNY